MDIIHNILTIQTGFLIICIGTKFLPMKVRQWRPMLDAKYQIERNHAAK